MPSMRFYYLFLSIITHMRWPHDSRTLWPQLRTGFKSASTLHTTASTADHHHRRTSLTWMRLCARIATVYCSSGTGGKFYIALFSSSSSPSPQSVKLDQEENNNKLCPTKGKLNVCEKVLHKPVLFFCFYQPCCCCC